MTPRKKTSPDAEIVAKLAALSGRPPATIHNYASLGLLKSDSLSETDVTGVRLIGSFEDSGFPLDILATLFRSEGLSLDFAREMLAFPSTMSNRTYGEVVAELSFSSDFAALIGNALGVPRPGPEDLATEADIAFLQLTQKALDAGVSRQALLKYLRALGRAVRMIAEAQRDLFRSEVAEPLQHSEIPLRDYLAVTASRRRNLQRLGFDATLSIQARLLEQLVFEDLSARLHEAMKKAGLPSATGQNLRVVCFLDVSAYTDLVRLYGDQRGAEIAEALEDLVHIHIDPATSRIIKTLGDGMLILFDQPAQAVEIVSVLLKEAFDRHGWSLHAGMAAGRVIVQTGDVYGATVNRAARLCAQAKPGFLLVDNMVFAQLELESSRYWRKVSLRPVPGLEISEAYERQPSPCRESDSAEPVLA